VSGSTLLVTGASSGIGRATALALAAPGARLVLVGRDRARLGRTAEALRGRGAEADQIPIDLASSGAARAVAAETLRSVGVPDVVVHAAGINDFALFEDAAPDVAERLMRVNVLAPMALTGELLPHMRRRGSGRLVFVGSVFGAIAFPGFAAYSASKFALRGFTEALRRELAGTGVGVSYVAPRGTRTPMTEDFAAAAAAAGMHLDDVDDVARIVADAAARGVDRRTIGVPESIFVRVNALFPSLVDLALRGVRDRLAPFARREPSAPAAPPHLPVGALR
jgi:short-subunit dehydrogenase